MSTPIHDWEERTHYAPSDFQRWWAPCGRWVNRAGAAITDDPTLVTCPACIDRLATRVEDAL